MATAKVTTKALPQDERKGGYPAGAQVSTTKPPSGKFPSHPAPTDKTDSKS